MKSLRPLERAGWEKCTVLATPPWVATLPLKSYPPPFLKMVTVYDALSRKRRPPPHFNHPNILTIFYVGEYNGSPYIVSELLEGESLRHRLQAGPLPVRKTIDYSVQVARGLAAAHDKGIVHRDLKPENIFLTRDGRAKILDFGLAKLTRPEEGASSSDGLTLTGASEPGFVLGTVGYMSPEQVRGHVAGAASDLFSFGATLYEMLTGKRAFRGETAADTMSAILKEDPTELAQSKISPALERIVRHCPGKKSGRAFSVCTRRGFRLRSVIVRVGNRSSRHTFRFRAQA